MFPICPVVLDDSGTGYSTAVCTADPEVLLLVCEGNAQLVWPATRLLGKSIALMAYGVLGIRSAGLVLVNNHDHFVAVGVGGQVLWTTRPISLCSDFKKLRVEGGRLLGMAEGSSGFFPFEVDLLTGEKTGGFWRD